MIKKLVIIILVLLMSGCSASSIDRGYNINSEHDKNTNVYIGIRTDKNRVQKDDEVVFTFSYGHFGNPTNEDYSYDGHIITVYILDEINDEKYTLYETTFSEDNFFSDKNLCSRDSENSENIIYNQNIDITIDFSDYKATKGKVYIIVQEFTIGSHIVNGETLHDRGELLDFLTISFETKNDFIILK